MKKTNKRKSIFLLSAILGSVALVSAGFAAWVITGDAAPATAEGTITVDTVENHTLSLSYAWQETGATGADDDAKITFGWNDDEVTGTKWLINNDNTKAEKLTATVRITVGNYSHLSNLKLTFTPSNATNWTAAVETDKLITAPTIPAEIAKDATGWTRVDDNNYYYDLDITCGWGTTFGGTNPMAYYNNQTKTNDLVSHAETNLGKVKTYLTDMTFSLKIEAIAAAE